MSDAYLLTVSALWFLAAAGLLWCVWPRRDPAKTADAIETDRVDHEPATD